MLDMPKSYLFKKGDIVQIAPVYANRGLGRIASRGKVLEDQTEPNADVHVYGEKYLQNLWINPNDLELDTVIRKLITYLELLLSKGDGQHSIDGLPCTAKEYYQKYPASWTTQAITDEFNYGELGQLIGELGHFWYDYGTGIETEGYDAHNAFESFAEDVLWGVRTHDADERNEEDPCGWLLKTLKHIDFFNLHCGSDTELGHSYNDTPSDELDAWMEAHGAYA